MSILDLFGKQDTVVTDVTRMEEGRVCIACLRGGRQLRLSTPQPTQKWLDSIGGLRPGDLVSVDWRQAKRFRPPHSEDGDWMPSSLKKTGALGHEPFYELLQRHARRGVRSAFGDPAFAARPGNPAFPANRGKRSLATIQASSIRFYRLDRRIRVDFEDERDSWSMVPVEDLRLWQHLDDCADCVHSFGNNLRALGAEEGLLRIGLGRPFQPDGREIGCFLQVNLVICPQQSSHFS